MAAFPAQRHPTLYFSNGDVVLSASIDVEGANTQLFRIHKFMLVHHSTAFANMFADANPGGSGESYDGVPLVDLRGDRAGDLALLLDYLYNPTQMVFKRFDPNTPLVVSGVIRLADKYGIETLRDHLINVVASDWPTTLKEWDFFVAEILAVSEKIALANEDKRLSADFAGAADLQCIRDHVPEPASAIAFAQEFGCIQILPAAFYALAIIPPSRDWASHDRNVGSCTAMLCARWDLLSKEDLLRYIRGSNHLIVGHPSEKDFMSTICLRLGAVSTAHPSTPGLNEELDSTLFGRRCAVFFRHLVAEHWNLEARKDLPRDPLRSLSQCLEYYDSTQAQKKVTMPCERCERVFRDRIPKLRLAVWAGLPRFFDLR